LLCLAGSVGGRLAAAQGGTGSTPTPAITSTPSATNTPAPRLPSATATLRVTGAPFIQYTDVEVLFPAAVVLEVGLEVPTERVEAASVRLFQEAAGLDINVQIDLSDPFALRARGDQSSVLYAWRVDPATAPRLFSFIEVAWTVRLKENVTANALSGFVFQDRRTTEPTNRIDGWQHVGADADHLRLYAHRDTLALNIVQANSGRVLDKLRQKTGLDLRYRFLIYEPGYRFCTGFVAEDRQVYLRSSRTTDFYVCRVTDALDIFRAQGYEVLERATQGLEQLQAQINERMIRDAHARLWRVSQPPAWFREGLFQLYAPRSQARALTITRDALRLGRLIPLTDLTGDPADFAQVELWRAQSYLLALYLASRYGADAPFEIAASLRDVYTFEGSLRATVNADSEAIYADWERWLLTEAADSAVLWSPYAPTTPTPTNTAAASPTRTPTSSIPTNTVAPRPTYTSPPFSTLTPIPPPPTNTPRPPGSLRTRTPAPTPIVEGPLTTIARSPLLLIGVVAGVVIVLGVVLGFILRRTNRPPP
jgi:hypothetical protein